MSEPLDAALEKLSRTWGAVGHLMGVMDSPELRDAFNGNLPRMTQFYIDLSQNEALYGKYKAIAAGAGYAALSAQKKRLSTRCGTSVCRAPTFPRTKRQN